MTEFNPTYPRPGDLDAEDRFALALVLSVVLHAVLTFGVQIKAAPRSGMPQRVMEVRIEKPLMKVRSAALTAGEVAVAGVTDKAEIVAPAPGQKEVQPPVMPDLPAIEPSHPLLPALEVPLLEDPTWYPAKQLDAPPVALHPVEPDYPIKGVEQGIEGNVVLLLLIDEAGVVKDASVVEANPEGIFDDSTLFAFRQARFTPAQKNGRAVKSRVLIRVTYELTRRNKAIVMPPVQVE